MTIPYRPLGLIKELIDKTGLEITHVWEELVFIEHNQFLLMFGEKGEDVKLVFNTDSNEELHREIEEFFILEGKNLGLTIERGGAYTTIPKDDGTFDIKFH